MKQILVLLTLVAAVSAYSQGMVNFQNKGIPQGGTPMNARISYGAGGPVTAGSNVTSVAISAGGLTYGVNAQAALYGGPVDGAENAMVLLTPAVGFRTGSNAGYVSVGADPTRIIPGIAPGAKAWVQVRAWDIGTAAASYEAAVASGTGYWGTSEIMQVKLGGQPTPADPAIQSPDLVDERTGLAMLPFSMTYNVVPEPSIIGLGLLGAIAGLFVFRRRN